MSRHSPFYSEAKGKGESALALSPLSCYPIPPYPFLPSVIDKTALMAQTAA